jgi:outer membrane biosynthesis protein TonB
MRVYFRGYFLSFLILGLISQSVFAVQGKNGSAARDAFTEGTHHFSEGKYDLAAKSFRKALSLAPSWRIYYNIGHSEAAAKRFGLALEAFQLYVAEGGDAIAPERLEEVFAQIEELRKKVGRIKVVAPDGAEIFIEGFLRGVAPVGGSINIAAGRYHSIQILLEGEEVLTRNVRVWANEDITIEVSETPTETVEEEQEPETEAVENEEVIEQQDEELSAKDEEVIETVMPEKQVEKEVVKNTPKPVGAPVIKAVDQKHPLRITGGIFMVFGSVGLAGAVTTGTIALVKSNNLKSDCVNKICPQNGELEATRAFAKATTIAIPIGSALAVTGLTLMIIGRRIERKGLSVAFMPVLDLGLAGMQISGSF